MATIIHRNFLYTSANEIAGILIIGR